MFLYLLMLAPVASADHVFTPRPSNDAIIINAQGKRLKCRTRVKDYSRFTTTECLEPHDWEVMEDNAQRGWMESQMFGGQCMGATQGC